MALGSTQPVTEISTMNVSEDEGRLAHDTDSLTVICKSSVKKIWEPGRLISLWTSSVVTEISIPVFFNLSQPTRIYA
jgi:hypothetical protein